jgi:hypothetical protein
MKWFLQKQSEGTRIKIRLLRIWTNITLQTLGILKKTVGILLHVHI